MITRGEHALFNLEIKKKRRSSINLDIHHSKVISSELGTLEWWISGLMLDLLFFLISRLNNACYPLDINLQIFYPAGLWIFHSEVFSSGKISLSRFWSLILYTHFIVYLPLRLYMLLVNQFRTVCSTGVYFYSETCGMRRDNIKAILKSI